MDLLLGEASFRRCLQVLGIASSTPTKASIFPPIPVLVNVKRFALPARELLEWIVGATSRLHSSSDRGFERYGLIATVKRSADMFGQSPASAIRVTTGAPALETFQPTMIPDDVITAYEPSGGP
jgi:hypothetical protein